MAKKKTSTKKKPSSKKITTTKAKTDFKINILAERDIKYVELDIEMNDKTEQMLIDYALKNIFSDRQALVNWAFINALKRGMETFKNVD